MNLADFEKELKIKFKNPSLLKRALTHRSLLNEAKDKEVVSNERLEFLGDAILSFVVSNWIFNEFPKYPEGKMTNLRSNLVKTGTLAKISRKLKVGDYLLLSKGEKESEGYQKPTLLANTLEAVIGAIFLDQGIEAIERFIKNNFEVLLKEFVALGNFKDYKSLLQEKLQAQKKKSPVYKTVNEKGPEHNKTFTINVCYQKSGLIATGVGRSKQKAEQEAARMALEKLNLKK